MLIPQQAQCETARWQGSQRISLAQLRRQLAEPSTIPDSTRQRLVELAQRVARIQAMGDEYARVELSAAAVAAVAG